MVAAHCILQDVDESKVIDADENLCYLFALSGASLGLEGELLRTE